MILKEATINELNDLVRLGLDLWPNSNENELFKVFRDSIDSTKEATVIYKDKNMVVGFILLSLRYDHVPGSSSKPVGYIEGIYVVPKYRKKGIGKKLAIFGEEWAKQKGCKEYASDAELTNIVSHEFHRKIGFKEANKLVCFIKQIE